MNKEKSGNPGLRPAFKVFYYLTFGRNYNKVRADKGMKRGEPMTLDFSGKCCLTFHTTLMVGGYAGQLVLRVISHNQETKYSSQGKGDICNKRK
jgi:hypothetical protein